MLGCGLVASASMPFSKPRGRVHRHLRGFAVAGEPFLYHLSWVPEKRGDMVSFCDRPDPRVPDMASFLHIDEEDLDMNPFDRATGYRRFRKLWDRENPASPPLLTPGQDLSQIEAMITPPRRGLLTFGEVQVYREDGLGFFRSHRRIPLKGELLVLPKAYPIPDFEMPSKGTLDSQTETLSLHVGDSGEFVSLREYRRGDSLKHIHWKSSARSGELHVRQYREEQGLSFGVVLDTAIAPQHEEEFEETVSLTAGLLDALSSDRHKVELLFVGAEGHRITTGRNGGSLLNALKALSAAKRQSDPGLHRLRESIAPSLEGVSGLVFLTTAWDGERHQLISSWLGQEIPTIVALVNHERKDPGPMASEPSRWLQFQPGRVKEELHKWGAVQ